MSDLASLTLRMRDAIGGIWREAAAFGVVGALAFVVDAGVYNLLVFGLPGTAGGSMRSAPVQASAVATGVSMIVGWAGNHHWTYRHRRREKVARELTLFAFVNIVGLVITAGAVALSRQSAGCDCAVGDNAARLAGWVAATLFRFFAYRRVVFAAG
ncbi:GtrA family protein [Streptomyces sp. NPDC001443]